MWWNRKQKNLEREREVWRRIREAEREAVITVMAEQMTDLIRKGATKPTSIDAWMKEFMRNQVSCGEVIFQAPLEWIRTHPDEALMWYSSHALPVGPVMATIVSGNQLIR